MNSSELELRDRFRGCLLGLACGDAVGTTVEFSPPGTFAPIADMVGGGPFGLKPGEWTDDTSMALCLAESLVEKGRFDAEDQMRRYLRWMDSGYLSSNGTCFDIGNATRSALSRFRESNNPYSGSTDIWSAGNGSIMRLAPVPMFFFPDRAKVVEMSGESSRTTHGAPECIDSCRLFGAVLLQALNGKSKAEILTGHGMAEDEIPSDKVRAIASGSYLTSSVDKIKGSGYVIYCLEAALWCFNSATTFRDAILMATNLGDDADTTAAVCGQVAGAYYGARAIPPAWLQKLAKLDTITGLADRLYDAAAV